MTTLAEFLEANDITFTVVQTGTGSHPGVGTYGTYTATFTRPDGRTLSTPYSGSVNDYSNGEAPTAEYVLDALIGDYSWSDEGYTTPGQLAEAMGVSDSVGIDQAIATFEALTAFGPVFAEFAGDDLPFLLEEVERL